MDKYVISQRHEKEIVIEDLPEDLDHIPLILNDDLPLAEAYELALDMLQSDPSVRVMMIGESRHSASVLSCEAQISSHMDVYSATFDTVSEVEHVWAAAVAGLERLQVAWVRRGFAVLVSRSPLPPRLPRLKSPNPRGKGARGRGGQSHTKLRRNFRGAPSYGAPEESRLHCGAAGSAELQLASQDSKTASSPRGRGASNGARGKTWTPNDKPSKSRGRSAKEKNLGDFFQVDDLQSSKDVQKLVPLTTTSSIKSERTNNNNSKESLELVRPSPEHLHLRSSGSVSAESSSSSKVKKRASLSRQTSDNFTYSRENEGIILGASTDACKERPSSKSINADEAKILSQNGDQIPEIRNNSFNSIKLERPLSVDCENDGPKSTLSNVNSKSLSADESAASQSAHDKKKLNSSRKVSFHLVPLADEERSSAIEGPSVRPKTGSSGSPYGKKNNSKNRRKKDERGNLDDFSPPVKNQGISAKVC